MFLGIYTISGKDLVPEAIKMTNKRHFHRCGNASD
jgi:hypothetical protein